MKTMASNCLLAACTAMAISGCGTPGSNQEAASSTGAAIGAGVGLVAGAASHRPVEGMAAGALIGGGAGSVVGQKADRKEAADASARQVQAAQARIAANPPVGKDDVILMTKANVSEDVIVNKVNTASYVTPITAEDIVDMKNAGVSDKVTNAMLNRLRTQAAQAEVIATPPARSETRSDYYYYVDPWPWPYMGYPRTYYYHPYFHDHSSFHEHGRR